MTTVRWGRSAAEPDTGGTNPKIRWGRTAVDGTAPAASRIRWGRAAVDGTAAVLVTPIADRANVEPESTVTITASLQDGGTADAWTPRRVSGAAVGITVSGSTITFTAPSDINGTSAVIGVTATVGATTSPEELFTVTVLPQTEWWWTGSAWTPRTEVWASPDAPAVPLIGASGMEWNSLLFQQGGLGLTLSGFETWRGRSVDGRMYFPARATWAEMSQTPTRPRDDLMVYCVPFFPTGIGGSQAAVIAGSYDANITAWAADLVTKGWNHNKTVIRLAWESNLPSIGAWTWTSSTYPTFIACWQKFVTVCRNAGLTDVLWDWCLNKGPDSQNSTVPWTIAYPGDAYVDVIGIDPYDMYTPSTDLTSWNSNISATGGSTGAGKNPGLQGIANFARAHGKQMSIDEWGIITDQGVNGGGDNAYYIARVFEFCQANKDIMAWDCTYESAATVLSTGTAPLAAAEYLKGYPLGWGVGTPVFTEAFTGTNGASWPAAWTATTGHTIQSNQGQQVTAASAYNTVQATRAGTANGDLLVSLTVNGTTERYHNVCGRWSGSSGYAVTVSTTAFQLKRYDAGTQTVLATSALTLAATTYKIRLQWTGTTIRAKIWLASGTEPGTWTVTATDSTYTAANSVQLLTTSGAAATAITAVWDDAILSAL